MVVLFAPADRRWGRPAGEPWRECRAGRRVGGAWSWGRDALACAITAHSGNVILRSLGHRAATLGLDPLIEAHLDNSARALDPACTAWRAIAGHWDLLSTGTNHGRGVSRVATELSDLIPRAGRLAYASPQ
jgi:hypothetical protein